MNHLAMNHQTIGHLRKLRPRRQKGRPNLKLAAQLRRLQHLPRRSRRPL